MNVKSSYEYAELVRGQMSHAGIDYAFKADEKVTKDGVIESYLVLSFTHKCNARMAGNVIGRIGQFLAGADDVQYTMVYASDELTVRIELFGSEKVVISPIQ